MNLLLLKRAPTLRQTNPQESQA